MLRVGGVLRGNDDVRDFHRLVIHVFDGHLALGIRTKPRDLAALANLRKRTTELVGIHDGRGHELGRFVAGVTKHQTLVTGALLAGLLALGLAGVHALRDVGRLLRDDGVHEHLVGVEHVIVVRVSDVADRGSRDGVEIKLRLRRDFAADDDEV